jgi:ubiquinone/menaquinone biosynthesis C-methylase UbiE
MEEIKDGDYLRYDWVTHPKYPEKFFHDVRQWETMKTIKSCGYYRSILDAGCGTGLITRHLKGGNVVGIDVNSWALERAKIHAPHATFIEASIGKLPFNKENFDIVLCTHTLEHIEEVNLVLNEFCRVLKPSGTFIGAVPSNHILWRFRKYLSCTHNAIKGEPFHTNYTKESIKELLEKYFYRYEIRSTCFGMEMQFVCHKR